MPSISTMLANIFKTVSRVYTVFQDQFQYIHELSEV
ncbi:MAG: hypothetical protein ACI8VC_002773 [Candidatus Endobugula sp.]|jgi:hypothetical protein